MARFYLGNLKKLGSHDESADRPNTLCFHNMARRFLGRHPQGVRQRPEYW